MYTRLEPVRHGEEIPLRDEDAAPPEDLRDQADDVKDAYKELRNRLKELGRALRAETERALLVVLQGRDAAGKGSTTRKVFRKVDAQSIRVTSFRAPTWREQRHDFLWRIHRAVPPRGIIGVFDRSHYEDVLVPRVRGELPDDEAEKRFRQINDFERMLAENGVVPVKLFLHISREEQKQRFLKRLRRADKHWKFRPSDVQDRKLWEGFTRAYRDVLTHTSTEWAPWYVVPADHKPSRNYLVARLLVDRLQDLCPSYPRPELDMERWEEELTDRGPDA